MKNLEEKLNNYGEVIYSTGADLPNQVYIIAQVHTDPFGRIHPIVPKVQLEIFRIGQFLAKYRNVYLILPEGRYNEVDYYAKILKLKDNFGDDYCEMQRRVTSHDQPLLKYIEKNIKKDPHMFDASTLISVEPNMVLQGAESRVCHEVALDSAMKHRPIAFDYFDMLREINLLLNIPKVSLREYELGRIPNMNSMAIFGLNHINSLAGIVHSGE